MTTFLIAQLGPLLAKGLINSASPLRLCKTLVGRLPKGALSGRSPRDHQGFYHHRMLADRRKGVHNWATSSCVLSGRRYL